MSTLNSEHIAFLGNSHASVNGWNKKLCFEARDTFFGCVDAQENGNKYRCPDEMYAYEMWCPNEFRSLHSHYREKRENDAAVYTREYLDKLNAEKALVVQGRFIRQ
uniref:Uncharacterized protein n=1 Tax=Strombidium rassoulzadegani TaxID=1082188 RepID=A0A7S3FTB1_9SPIT|mmetsp:Transcript_13841/g.23611  ORF Transcript_13841/g.23611 Transcript_13841/m.23611 type:complete len:106 (+) Transcript_13841:20-337(+)